MLLWADDAGGRAQEVVPDPEDAAGAELRADRRAPQLQHLLQHRLQRRLAHRPEARAQRGRLPLVLDRLPPLRGHRHPGAARQRRRGEGDLHGNLSR